MSSEDANEKVREIYFTIKRNLPSESNADPDSPLVVRSNRAVTIVGKFPCRHIQIITRLYKSPAEVLIGFDVDACAVGYDGTQVWGSERWIRAINKRYNLVNRTRRSFTYESRLFKYGQRFFERSFRDIYIS